MNSWLKVLSKRLNIVYFSEITVMTLTFRDRTAGVTYCADGFFYADFLRVIALNVVWDHFLGAKLHCHPTHTP